MFRHSPAPAGSLLIHSRHAVLVQGMGLIVHELLHFYVPNHGRLWKSLMRVYLGDYERAESKLRNKAAMLSR
jgi:hypothetical protein